MTLCPLPQALQEKMLRLGWYGWIPTPGVTDEDRELYITLGEQNIRVMGHEEALSLPDDELQRRIETVMGMSFEEACERYGIDVDEVPGSVRYSQSENCCHDNTL